MSCSAHHRNLKIENSLVIFCDLQVGFQHNIQNIADIIDAATFLRNSARLLSIPCLFSEQWPERYGHVVEKLDPADEQVFSKRTFSLMGSPRGSELVRSKKREYIVFAGVQSHICVQQSVLDLLANGFSVFLVTDAMGSRRRIEHTTALESMKQEGAMVSTTEAIVFQWLRSVDAPCFDAFQQLQRPT
ncbi:hypothetical protein GAYE_SCF54G6201 [Galdieria yellowstonensis]|uniref:Isochorismatase-like domain-containing protein n=1 Tax=Galdieria yellowstonensis TaxID=3028027 RepID=A0AAV9ILT8_9RHOD|nr:hypothetical protein GAYE_SCF54G6201 [Galdieria yellowstonensis]